ncbi:hypothetical protein [Nostoc sp. MG11]|uniref:hypothetical protein n=1 Tax=Nostoc sp. MG11 TaxID=2721166 RepID=UPI001868AC25|nr:hypothetical protein [Nostoc sp. MG11]
MSWKPYALDEKARQLVKNALEKDQGIREASKQAFKESYKMRETVVYGLERFWGEAKRHEKDSPALAIYWKETWNILAETLEKAEVKLPKHDDVAKMADKLWQLKREDQQIALAVLTQLCDCMVWWTQRYKNDAKQ